MYQILSRQFITMSEFYLKMSFELTLRLYTKTQIFSLNVMQLKLFLEIGQLITLFNKKFLSVILDNNKQNMYIISWFCGAHYIILIFKSIIIYFKHNFFLQKYEKISFRYWSVQFLCLPFVQTIVYSFEQTEQKTKLDLKR